ncbi:ATP-dependent helicase [Bacillus coahuilensis p1.1.43]|uniref:ATP-dependent helicase/nuclease subunit A n=1 Tax=Bacillus coahuilensis p1.1.43 TaxID=1150625 RepID=A0A147KAL0_9BACI|nr:helicase-exonuclease AddAB subunit AddA [Bacillus coahuilensis]KUP07741.1 ATP-dependent helicase [Bacillus coahuilensis p1.1.43]
MNNIPIKPKDAKWTNDQWKAIWAKDRDILVAAAAGSGKTAVLVERIIQKVVEKEHPINVDELLVVTFTNAAAAEMRHRIGEALEKEMKNTPNSHHLRKQLTLLNKASISTLHSFCLEVIRKYYYSINIDPGFRIADDTERALLMDEVLDDLFEEEYGRENNDHFYQVVDTFSNDRSDEELQNMVRVLYEFSRSHPNPNSWLDELVSTYDVHEDTTSIDELPFMQQIKEDIMLQLEGALNLLEQGIKLTKIPGGPAPYASNFEDDRVLIESLLRASEGSFSESYPYFQELKYTRLKPCKGDEYDDRLMKDAKKIRDQVKKQVGKIQDEFFTRRPESYVKDLREMKPHISVLIELVKKFHVAFQVVKEEKSLVDFSDLEHYTLEILTNPYSSEGQAEPSEAALFYKEKFKEVLVDEYQDTNMVQETIIGLITGDQEETGNLFMVGDVKQSIYRFRLAEPNLFLGKYNRFTTDQSESGLRIDLSQNFRSRKEVLEGTNYLFKQIMGVRVGEIEYDEQAELKVGAAYPVEEDYPVELALIDLADQDTNDELSELDEEAVLDREDLEKSQLEARYMAQKVRKLIDDKTPIYDAKTGTHRSIEFRDIVILLRSMPWAPEIMEEFKKYNIPIYANISKGYFDATEVSIMISLLKMIDNPYQDIPLASVLRSPIVGLDEEEMAIVRLSSRGASFYEAVQAFVRKESEQYPRAYNQLKRFMEKYEHWRVLARQNSLASLIWQLYRDTDFYDFVGGLPGGKQRQANLRALHDRARQYEETSFRGLFRFLRFVERMRERGDDLGAARALSEQEDVVRLMTIHSSKGLEFPVVFIAGLSKQFNLMDMNKSYLLDKELGFATKYIHSEKRITYPSIIQLAFKRKKRLETIAEEMRVLYVALTRAKEKLYLVGTVKDLQKSIEEWKMLTSHSDWLLPDYTRANAVSYLDWVGPSLVRHNECHAFHNGQLELLSEDIIHHPSCWKIELYSKDEFELIQHQEKEHENWIEHVKNGTPVSEEVSSEVVERMNWSYVYKSATSVKSKQSVSEIKRMFEVQHAESAGNDFIKKLQKPIMKRPLFLQKQSLTPAEVGTAMHTVMQHVSLEKEPSYAEISELVQRLESQEILTNEQADAISVEDIVAFFTTRVGKRLLHAEVVHREIPFSLRVNQSELGVESEEDEGILVQGIIDLVFKDENGWVLVDYKTDNISERFQGDFNKALPILEKRYKIQVELYKKALEEIWKHTIDENYLFFFDGGYTISF